MLDDLDGTVGGRLVSLGVQNPVTAVRHLPAPGNLNGRHICRIERDPVLRDEWKWNLSYRIAVDAEPGPHRVVAEAVFSHYVLGVCRRLQRVISVGQPVYYNVLAGEAGVV